MPRIRSLKPEIVEDEALGRCSIGAQLTFDRLITQADDHGRFRANAALLKGKLFPYLDDLSAGEVGGWLAELVAAGVARTYRVRQQEYGVLTSWAKHQRIDNAAKPMHPSPEEADGDAPRISASRGEIPSFAAGEERRGEEQEGSGNARGSLMDSPAVNAYLAAARKAGISDAVLYPRLVTVDTKARDLIAQGVTEASVVMAYAEIGRNGGAVSRPDIELERQQRGQGQSETARAAVTAQMLRDAS